jgi:hypothetical protein
MPMVDRRAPFDVGWESEECARRLCRRVDCRLRHAVIDDVEEPDRRARFANFARHALQRMRVARAHAGKVNEWNTGHRHRVAP